MQLADYTAYNSSFRKKFIYRLGGCTGFFSEYNNMILAIHYCIVNRIQFVLESESANFSSGKGWEEFFLPFCKEKKGKWLKRFNHRRKPAYADRREWFCFNVYKELHPHYIYMYTLFNAIRRADAKKTYCIPELGLKGTLLENCSAIHSMIWRYNEPTAREMARLTAIPGLPQKYIGIHIRQGDKTEESSIYSPRDYMEVARAHSDIKDAFVLTDDYSVIETLEKDFPDYSFFTLCQPDETGYSYGKLLNMPIRKQRESYLRLWASMDIMAASDFFIGTYSANPGMNMGFRMPAEKIRCLDFDEWRVW